jgi:hypothetical protein
VSPGTTRSDLRIHDGVGGAGATEVVGGRQSGLPGSDDQYVDVGVRPVLPSLLLL